jgi:hypothetical protein
METQVTEGMSVPLLAKESRDWGATRQPLDSGEGLRSAECG